MCRPVLPTLSATFAVAALLAAGCSVQDGPTGQRAPTTTTRASTTTVATTTTTVPLSSAVIEIGPAVYELDAVCAAGGASEVEVAVNGLDVNGKPVVGRIRAFEAEPYVGLQVGEGDEAVLFEPRLEGVLPFEFDGERLEFVDVEFVTDLDLLTGEFVPGGVGSVVVECLAFVRSLPADPFS
jgi:hypothetical protein